MVRFVGFAAQRKVIAGRFVGVFFFVLRFCVDAATKTLAVGVLSKEVRL
jgi:hypothetical protein